MNRHRLPVRAVMLLKQIQPLKALTLKSAINATRFTPASRSLSTAQVVLNVFRSGMQQSKKSPSLSDYIPGGQIQEYILVCPFLYV
jgi:hypothetical protein